MFAVAQEVFFNTNNYDYSIQLNLKNKIIVP